MGSNDKEVQQGQKERAAQELALRLETLTARGVATAKVEKDRVVRRIRADLRAFNRRLTAIDEQKVLLEKVAAEKAAKAATPKQKKKKEKVEEKPAESGKKKKAKKK